MFWGFIAYVVVVGLQEGSGNKRMKGGQGAQQESRRSKSNMGVRWRRSDK